MDFSALTDALNNFINAFTAGQGRVDKLGGGIVNTLLIIEICIFGLSMASGATQVWDIVRRVLAVGTWLYIVRHFGELAKMFVDSLVQAGLLAGGGAGGRTAGIEIIRDPSQIAGMFLDVTDPIAQKFARLKWDVGEKVTLGFLWMILSIPFLAMACTMFAAVVDYYLVRLLATVLIPFSLNQHTRFLSEKGINGVVGAGLKLMVLSCILAVIQPVLKSVHIDADFSWNQFWALFFTAGACGTVVFTAPRTASTLLFGSPGLSAPPLASAAGAVAFDLVSRGAKTFVNAMSKSPNPPAQPPSPPPPPGAGAQGSSPTPRPGSGPGGGSPATNPAAAGVPPIAPNAAPTGEASA